MKATNGRLLYELLFWGIIGAVAYFYRGMYDAALLWLTPLLQAYTTVGMILLGVGLFFLTMYLREAIAATAIGLLNHGTGGHSSKLGSSAPASSIRRTARRFERQKNFQAAGEAYESLEQWQDAARVYERGNLYGRAANAWRQLENAGKAIELYEKEGNFEAAADICMAEGLKDRAVRNFRTAGNECLQNNQFKSAASFYERAEDFDKAGGIFEQAHKPDCALACYQKAGNKDKLLELVFKMHPSEYHTRGAEFTRLVQKSAETLLLAGHAIEAAQILEDCNAVTRAAEVYASCKVWDKSAELYLKAAQPQLAEQMISNIEDRTVAAEISARLAVSKGDWKAAGELYEQAGKQSQAIDAFKKSKDFGEAARIYEFMGRFIMAGEMYSSCKNFPAAANAYAKAYDWRNAAECFEESGDLAHAVEAYANAGSYLKAGTIALKMTDNARAVEYLQRVPPASPDFIKATAFLAAAFYYQQQHDMAYELFNRVMDDLPISRDNLLAYYAYARSLETDNPKKSLGLLRQILGVDVHYSDVADRVVKLEKIVTSMSVGASGKTPSPPPISIKRRALTPFNPSHSVNQLSYNVRRSNGIAITSNSAGDFPIKPQQQSGETGQLSAHSLAKGTLWEARYRIESETVPYGRVSDHMAVDTVSGGRVTVRTFPRPEDETAYSATMNLLSAVTHLRHKSIATVLQHGEAGNVIYTVAPLPDGINLRQWIKNKGPMSVTQTRQIMGQLLEALEYAHSQDICHLNLRPEVVMIRQDMDSETNLCLSGFGAPVRQPQNTEPVYLTIPDQDPQYLAPEQIIGTDVDSRTDVYAFGLLLFFVLTGRTPFDVKRVNDTQEIARMQVQVSLPRPSAIRATLPSILDEVFLRCVNKSPLSRYQSVSELLADMQGVHSNVVS